MLTIPFELSLPAVLQITDPVTKAVATVDVEVARQALARAEQSATRWEDVRTFLTGLFPAEAAVTFAENQLMDFNNAVIAASIVLDDERKKKIGGCVCSLVTSLASPPSS